MTKDKYLLLMSELSRCGIGRCELTELLEAASWALQPARRSRCGDYLDLNDDYLETLADKLAKYMNPEEDE